MYSYPLVVKAIWFDESLNELCWINTTKLPHEEEVLCSSDPARVAKAIRDMEIRGAPAIGVAAALVVGAYALKIAGRSLEEFTALINNAIHILLKTRPTAYNLFYALTKMQRSLREALSRTSDTYTLAKKLVETALEIYREDVEANLKIGEYGAELVPEEATILTHCNAGALATSAYGTALAVIRIAWYKGKKIRVIATETRPLLQGARLTVYELVKEGIPLTLITDNSVGLLMRKGKIDLVVVGADRITRDGYVVNKIGTYMIALAAHKHKIPFYVAAPTSTIDIEHTIDQVIIEERDPAEVKYVMGKLITLEQVNVYNYAFDITDPELVTSIITELGIIRPPYNETIPVNIARKLTT
ncbi:MAG: S-methyl-5-thioribose-1-phosphate isomerase [Desulfurococcaceae archaeon]|nr:S-methyl-5-thioribose-1-phosphate isomerase [Desulfurococcaceae archaeon]